MHQGEALAGLHEGEVDLVLGWARMPYGPPVRTERVGTAELVAVARHDHPVAAHATVTSDVFARHSFVLFERRSSADVFDLLISALTGRQREQLQVYEAPSFDDGTDAILRAAVEGPGLTVAVREMFEPASCVRCRSPRCTRMTSCSCGGPTAIPQACAPSSNAAPTGQTRPTASDRPSSRTRRQPGGSLAEKPGYHRRQHGGRDHVSLSLHHAVTALRKKVRQS